VLRNIAEGGCRISFPPDQIIPYGLLKAQVQSAQFVYGDNAARVVVVVAEVFL
jgi:hypothetical protein